MYSKLHIIVLLARCLALQNYSLRTELHHYDRDARLPIYVDLYRNGVGTPETKSSIVEWSQINEKWNSCRRSRSPAFPTRFFCRLPKLFLKKRRVTLIYYFCWNP